MISPGEFPYTGVNGISYDEGSYAESLDRAEQQVAEAGWAAERDRLRGQGLRAGDGLRLLLRADRVRHACHVAAPDADDARLRHRLGADGPVRRGHRDHRDVRPRPGARDHVRPDRGRPAGRAPGAGAAAPGRHRPGLLRLGHLGQPLHRDRRRRGQPGRRAGRGPAPRGRRAPARGQRGGHRAGRRARPGSAATTGAAIGVGELARIVHFQTHRLPEPLRYGLEARSCFDPPGTFSNALPRRDGAGRPRAPARSGSAGTWWSRTAAW